MYIKKYSRIGCKKLLFSVGILNCIFVLYMVYFIYIIEKNVDASFRRCPLVLRKRVMPYECNGSFDIITCSICGTVLHRQS